jgi:hypothetical protein
VNTNDRDPLAPGPAADDPRSYESVGGAPRPVEPMPAAPPAFVMPEPALPALPGERLPDEQVGRAPGADEQVGPAPAPPARQSKVPLLVGIGVVVLAILALILGISAK